MIAHIREKDGEEQSLKQHCEETARLCMEMAETINCPNTAKLIGLLHDFGKGNKQFKNYLIWSVEHSGENPPSNIPHPPHAAAGATYAYQRWYKGEDEYQKKTAQLIAMCICGHHTGLANCLDEKGESEFLNSLDKERYGKEKENYKGSVQYFLENIADEKRLDELFAKACEEIKTLDVKSSMHMGLLVRLFLSILVDADRWNSACFEYGIDCFKNRMTVDWSKLSNIFEEYIKDNFSAASDIGKTRWDISNICAEKSTLGKGIYKLEVPTGGGKTLASLRFALNHAKENRQKRIFYVIPYNTILDQNAQDIRAALKEYPYILEHHSNVVFETDDEQLAYKRLTERWDSDIILTSMVQFMNAVYRKENTNARRMHQLSDSVIIFDEIQALPNQCIRLFEKAIEFLTKFCGCTLLLCTATQPKLEFKQDVYALIPNELDIHKKLKRVMYIPQLKRNKTFVEAAFEILPFLQDGKSVLMIVNTKIAAFEIFANAKENLINVGFVPVKIDENISDEEIESLSETCSDNEILCIHLSTLMCSEHRKKLLKWLKIWNAKKKKVLCVSTALIEAGINVSFPVVVRSLAGLPSIVQAAGRCNRNMELECGEVYIWDLKEENLTKLADVQHGKDISRQIICNMNESDMNLDNPEMIEKYFEKMEPYLENEKGDPIVKEFIHEPSTLFRMLSKNTKFKMNAGSNLDKLSFYQSFKTAGEAFHVIDENTRSVLVPYGRGKEIIEQLGNAYLTATEKNRLLKEAQRYSVNLYKNVFERLRDKEKAIVTIGNDEILTLREGYYDLEVGICTEKQELEDMIY